MQVAVIGLGSFGSRLAQTLHDLGGEVIAIDRDEELVEEIKPHVSQAISLDATDEKALSAIGMSEVDVAVVAMAEEMEVSIMVTTLLRQMGVTKIIARAISNLHAKVLLEVGASQVLRLEEEMGEHTAKWIIAPKILKQHEFADGYSLVEEKPKPFLIGRRVKDLNLREKYNIGVAAILKRRPDVDEYGKSTYSTIVSCPPDPTEIITRDDIMILYGSDADILKFTQET